MTILVVEEDVTSFNATVVDVPGGTGMFKAKRARQNGAEKRKQCERWSQCGQRDATSANPHDQA